MTELPESFAAGSPADPAATGTALEPLPRHPVGSWVATLDPGYFAIVMATGILSFGVGALGHPVLSDAFFGCAALAFVVLLVAYIARAVAFPRRFAATLRTPGVAVEYFTVVAGTNVLARCLVERGWWLPGLVLGAAALLLWIALGYGLFASIMLAGNRPTLRDINGSWLIWIVGTQSVATLAASIAGELPWTSTRTSAGDLSIVLWGIGVVFYLVFIVILFLRLFLIETTPGELGPGYWLMMGATAISVQAAASILELGRSAPTSLLSELRPFLSGVAVMLWAFGTWFIPLLVIFGVWRHLVRRYSWRYDPQLWSVAFPLGMYTVASLTLGREIHAGFMTALATGWLWIALVAWLAVVVLMVLALVRRDGPQTPMPGRSHPRRAEAP